MLMILLLLPIAFIILLTKISVKATLEYNENKATLHLKVKALFGLVRISYDLPKTKESKEFVGENAGQERGMSRREEEKNQFDPIDPLMDIYTFIQKISKLKDIVTGFLKKVHVSKFDWSTQFGTGDAASTGILTGIAWAIKGVTLGLFSKYFTVTDHPIIGVTPHFNKEVFQTRFQCIFRFRIGHAIVAGIQLFNFWRKTRRKPIKAVPNIQNAKSETN